MHTVNIGAMLSSTILNTLLRESLTFGMVQSGLSPYESIWVIHMHHCIQHPSFESKYRQIKPNLKKL